MLGAETPPVTLNGDGGHAKPKIVRKPGRHRSRLMGPDEIEMKAAIADMPEIAHTDLGMIAPDFCSHGLAKCGDVAPPEPDVTADDLARRHQADRKSVGAGQRGTVLGNL